MKGNQKTLNFEEVNFLKIYTQLIQNQMYIKILSVLVNNAG